MKPAGAILGSAIFLVVAPGMLAVYIPWRVGHWHLAPPLLGSFLFRIIGALMIVAGLPVLLDSFARFAIQGLGTPAPVAPPQRLVATGLYRYVRNPMYVAVSLLVFGQDYSSAVSSCWNTDLLFGWDFSLLLFFMKSLH
jgi:protein-S-isoprenylcysteine O-methyltransferase Ste14